MKKLEVIRFRKEARASAACPYCHSTNYIKLLGPVEKKVEQTIDRVGYPIIKETYNEVYDCTCKECSGKYIIDFGMSTYSIYTPPHFVVMDIVCFARYESEWYEDFEILATRIHSNVTNSDEYIYFINYESDQYPIFITKSQADEFLKNSDKAHNFAYCHNMTRYR